MLMFPLLLCCPKDNSIFIATKIEPFVGSIAIFILAHSMHTQNYTEFLPNIQHFDHFLESIRNKSPKHTNHTGIDAAIVAAETILTFHCRSPCSAPTSIWWNTRIAVSNTIRCSIKTSEYIVDFCFGVFLCLFLVICSAGGRKLDYWLVWCFCGC